MVQSFVKSYRAPPNRRPGYILGKFGAKMGKVAGYVAADRKWEEIGNKSSCINQTRLLFTQPDLELGELDPGLPLLNYARHIWCLD